jgi:predicted CDP-diglyceride synthetase/phosphatidate cytidylyltransferase
MGVPGGLRLSAMKRGPGAKDWITMIEGRSGVLDRLDPESVAAPGLFQIERFFCT